MIRRSAEFGEWGQLRQSSALAGAEGRCEDAGVSVPLTVVSTVGEADVIAALLRTEGIFCTYPQPLVGEGQPLFAVEIRVSDADYERARALIEAT